MNYNKYFALKSYNRNSYHKAAGGGKYGSGERHVSSDEAKRELMNQIVQEALAKKAALKKLLEKREDK